MSDQEKAFHLAPPDQYRYGTQSLEMTSQLENVDMEMEGRKSLK